MKTLKMNLQVHAQKAEIMAGNERSNKNDKEERKINSQGCTETRNIH
jgi:hypothetical protein